LVIATAHALIKIGKDAELKEWVLDKKHKVDIFEKAKHHLIYGLMLAFGTSYLQQFLTL
jgi:hypothetical protein